jgi:hypothetical protein
VIEALLGSPIPGLLIWAMMVYSLFSIVNKGTFCRISKKSLDFYTLGIMIHSISFSNIKEIRFAEKSDLFRLWLKSRFSGNYGNKLRGKIVLIKTKTGYPTEFTITPDSPDDFIKKVQDLMLNS